MHIKFINGWRGNSMRDGGCFPVSVIDVFMDLHPTYRVLSIAILNFFIEIHFGRSG